MSRRSVLEVVARLVPENPHWQAEQKLELFRAFCERWPFPDLPQ
jgi:hypothetical protein